MPAPTFVAAYNVNYANNVTPKTLTITTRPGDLVVVYAGSENGTTILNTPSGNGITPTSGNGTEATFVASAQYLVYGAYYSDAGAAGAKTIGHDTNASQKYSMVAIEVFGTVPSPLAAYSFNATGSAGSTLTAGTSITDDSGNGNTLVTQNGASTMSVVTGSNGVAVEANSLTYAELQNASAIKPSTAVTWMCRARMIGTTWGWGQIFGRNNDDTGWGEAFSFYLDSNNKANRRLFAPIQTNSSFDNHKAASFAIPSLNTWAHIAATWSVSGGNTSRYFSIFRNTQYNEIANQIQIDDVRVFDKQLTASEITPLMNTPVASLGGSTTIPLDWVMGVNT